MRTLQGWIYFRELLCGVQSRTSERHTMMLSFARWVSHEWVSCEPFADGIRIRTFCLSATPTQEIPECRLPLKVLRLTLSLFCRTLLLRNSATHSGVHWCHHTMKRLSGGWACLSWFLIKRRHSSVDRIGVWVKLSFLPWRYSHSHFTYYSQILQKKSSKSLKSPIFPQIWQFAHF